MKRLLGMSVVAATMGLGIGEAHAVTTTYALPAQGSILKNPANEQNYWTNTYGRMVHRNDLATNELDFPLTTLFGATGITATVNFDLDPQFTPPFFDTIIPKVCTQLLVMNPSGSSVLTMPVQCQTAPVAGVDGASITTASLSPPSSHYAFVAVWAFSRTTINSVSYAITK